MLTLEWKIFKYLFFLWSFSLWLVFTKATNHHSDGVPNFDWKRMSIICTNLAAGVQCDTMDIRLINFGGFSPSHRNVISVNMEGYYALGFQQIAPGEFFLSIYPFYPSSKSAGPAVWTANREAPVDENGTLAFLSTGTLELRDSKGQVMWWTRTLNMGVERFIFSPEQGKIELLNGANQSVWSSFDHPSDTLLQTHILSYGGPAVVSSRTPSGRGIGRYSLVLRPGGLVLLTTSEGGSQSEAYRVFGFNHNDNLSTVSKTCRYPTTAKVLLPSSRYAVVLEQTNTTTQVSEEDLRPELCKKGENDAQLTRGIFDLSRLKLGLENAEDKNYTRVLKLEHNGTLSVYQWKRRTADSSIFKLVDLFGFDNPCTFPDRCGAYGICTPSSQSSYTCSCPSGRSWERIASDGPDLGCRLLEDTTTCEDQTSNDQLYLLELVGVDYFANDLALSLSLSRGECRRHCLERCSCTAAFYRSAEGQCFLSSQVIHSLKGANGSFTAFVKVRHAKLGFARTESLIIGLTTSTISLALVLTAVCFWRAKSKKEKDLLERFRTLDISLDGLAGLPQRFSLKVLEKATGGFKDKLGEGGFGTVYGGMLPDGTRVAVKRLEGPGQGSKQFRAEVDTIGGIHHRNLVQLCGFCSEGHQRLLVYEYMVNGSLDRLLFADKWDSLKQLDGSGVCLDWVTRLKIAKDTARGLAYLHEGCAQKIIHLDIKPQNILLDQHFQAKVADFGLSTMVRRDKQSLVVTKMRGTPGYLAPEWLHMSAVSEKTDVYSYGMVLLEIVSGRRLLGPENVYLPAWAFQKLRAGQLEDIIDSRIADSVNKEETKLLIGIAFACIHENPMDRPKMASVMQMLEGVLPAPQQPRVGQLQRILSMSTISTSECSSSSTLTDATGERDVANHLGHTFNGVGQRATDRGMSYLVEGGDSTAYIHSVTAPR